MELEKIRNLTDDELTSQQTKSAEQLFRLRFEKSLGNNEGIKKLRVLKLDIARIKTVERERALGNEKVGLVVSTKMQKTIVVEIEMRKAHPKYKRVMKSNKKFYAHDELNSARVGDVVRIREARPLSKLKRWSLEEIVRRSSLSQLDETKPVAEVK